MWGSGSDQRTSQRSPSSGISIGLLMLHKSLTLCKSGERPPCMHNIFSSISAMMGIALKTSTKYFQIFRLYLLLPKLSLLYTRRRNHRCDWCWHFHGFLSAGKSFRGIWSCSKGGASCIRLNFFPYRHNRQWRDSYCLQAILHTQKLSANLRTARVYRLFYWLFTTDFEWSL